MMLANAVRETSDGSVSAETMEFLKSKCRPLPCSDRDKTVLYARNFDAWAHNIACVNRWSGKISKYLAKDSGSKEILSRSPAHEVWLPYLNTTKLIVGLQLLAAKFLIVLF